MGYVTKPPAAAASDYLQTASSILSDPVTMFIQHIPAITGLYTRVEPVLGQQPIYTYAPNRAMQP